MVHVQTGCENILSFSLEVQLNPFFLVLGFNTSISFIDRNIRRLGIDATHPEGGIYY